MRTTFVRQPSDARSGNNKAAEATTDEALARPRPAAFKARANGSATNDRNLIEALTNSKVFQDYERAFTEATGLPVALRPVETWQLPHHGKRNEGPFCAIISETSRA
jgi:hypothetical protein